MRALAAAASSPAHGPSVGPLMESTDDERAPRGRCVDRAMAARHAARAARRRAVRREGGDGHRAGCRRAAGRTSATRRRPGRTAACVARLRAAGAIVLGQTPMTEYGMTPLGFNPKRTMPRNPHATDRVAGGSSTGTAVAVATGLVPFGMGGDGGGSIRIPSSFCGVFGIKPTWGRVSKRGDVFGGTVAHVGPHRVVDAGPRARASRRSSGRDAGDPQTDLAPPTDASSFVKALRARRARDAHRRRRVRVGGRGAGRRACGPRGAEGAREGGRRPGRRAPRARAMGGARRLPDDRDGGVLAATATCGGSARRSTRTSRSPYATLGEMSATEYTHSQRLRSGLRAEVARAFGDVDLIALPTTATPAVRVTDAEFEGGFLDRARPRCVLPLQLPRQPHGAARAQRAGGARRGPPPARPAARRRRVGRGDGARGGRAPRAHRGGARVERPAVTAEV